MSTPQHVDHFFRHEYGRLVSMLARRFGTQNIELVEDAAQNALLAALESWPRGEVPDNPSAWLFRVAQNDLLGHLRKGSRRELLLDEHRPEALELAQDEPSAFLPGEIREDQLRLLFVCCDESIAVESQLVFALKTLCGFDVGEIARRLFTSEANVYKRLGRARSRLRELPITTTELAVEQLASRLPAVHAVLYLLFTEGYLSSHAETPIRRELCAEAVRLTRLLAEHPVAVPATFALLGLMHLHTARLAARQDGAGGLLLLEEQDRGLWDQHEVAEGLSWLVKSAQGDGFTRYHAEAGIAAEHCMAPSFAETRWDRIVDCYELLERLAPSPLHTLNRAVALAELSGPAAGLAVVEGREPPSWLAGSYLWSAVLADLHRRCGNERAACHYREAAIAAAPTAAVADLLRRRLMAGAD